ncbi:class IV lanthionine synthetase LanL [Micromonosporaceae bacterium B7E4]
MDSHDDDRVDPGSRRRPDHVADDTLLVDCVRSLLTRNGADGWQVRPGDFWCQVTPPAGHSRTQGWKLHLSATPLSAPLVLARAAGVLIRRRCAFKFAATLDRVEELVCGLYDRGGAGKFITAYPEMDDAGLRSLADELHQITEGLPGPGILSDRPYRTGSLVHYRYGAFSGFPVLGNDGTYEAMLVAADGTLALDHRKAWFTPPPWAPPDPFVQERCGAPGRTPNGGTPRPVLLTGRYVVREVIRHAFTGGVYRAVDERDGASVVVKQARPHAGATVTGQEIRDLRRHEAAMLELFESSGVTPRLVDLFTQQGELFLVQEAIPGTTLRRWVADTIEFDDSGRWGPPLTAVAAIARRMVDLVELAHDKGFVLRDFNPNNVMVTENDELRLIDLELLARPGDRITRGYTSAYGAPEQVNAPRVGAAPSPAADLYSLGASLFYLASGVDPLLPRDRPEVGRHHERIETWLDHLARLNPAARWLAPVVAALMNEDPDARPGLADVRAALAGPVPAHSGEREPVDPDPVPARSPGEFVAGLKRMIADALDHLLCTARSESPERLWPTGPYGALSDPLNVQHGAAGVLGVLVRAYRAEPDPALAVAVDAAAGWISRRVGCEPRILPGLYFGRSGTAWALLEAGRARENEDFTRSATELARRLPSNWPNPDVCHGIAGAGLTQLRFWEVTGEETFLDGVRRAADAAVAAVERRDGLVLWPIPKDFVSALAGLVHYGFAHGVAGVGAFLLAAGRATGESRYVELAASAAETLRSVAHLDRGAAYWRSGDSGGPLKANWCSGSSGVGTFLVQMWRENGDDRLRELVVDAASAVHRSRWQAGTTQCHGLAGDGEFLLDLAAALDDERYRGWAEDLATCIHLRHAVREGRMVPPDETGTAIVADYGVGLAGVLAFLLRLRDGGQRLWLPECFTECTDHRMIPVNNPNGGR